MCGLAGVMSSWLSEPEIGVFRQLMSVAQFRGRDGSGIAMAPEFRHQDFGIVRSTACADSLAHSEEFGARLKKMKRASALVGHARLPTSGGLSVEDAHPVVQGHIIGVHNGTMKTVYNQKVNATDHDTVMFYAAVAEHGIEETIKKSSGEYCFVWLDKKDFTLNFLRNDKRPLYFGHFNDNTSTVYWASEPSMLSFVLGRRASSKQTIVLRSLPENTLFKFALGTVNIRSTVTLKPEEAAPFVYTPPEHRARTSGVPKIIQPPKPTGQTLLDEAFARAAAKTKTPEVDGGLHIQYGPQLEYVRTIGSFQALLNAGCAVCQNPQDYNLHYKTKQLTFINEDMFVCKPCATRDPTMVAILQQSAGRMLN